MKIRRFFRRLLFVVLALLCIWTICVQSGCLSMRTPDRAWSAKLREKGQPRDVQFFDIQSSTGHTVHAAAMIGADSLPWIMMVHGSPGSADGYLDYLADTSLSRRANLISIDRPGFGYTDFGKPEPSLQRQAADMDAVIEKLAPGRKVMLLGHSLGGPIICRYAMDYPEKTASLVIVAGSVDPALEPHQWWVPVVDAPPVCWMTPLTLWASNHEIRHLDRELTAMMPLWPRIQCPVRIVHAQDDQLVPIANAEFTRKMLTGCKDLVINILPKGNHFILWSNRSAVEAAIFGLIHP